MPTYSVIFGGTPPSPDNLGTVDKRLNYLLRSQGNKKLVELFFETIGAAAGAAASAVSKMVAPSPPAQISGNRNIITETFISRNTTAADITRLKAMVSQRGTINTVFKYKPGVPV
jgi:hypothetical protein